MDDKRFYRNLKKEVKKSGNRKKRRFLKDLSADPGDFDYGSAESSAFNGRDGKRKKKEKGKIQVDAPVENTTTDEGASSDPQPESDIG